MYAGIRVCSCFSKYLVHIYIYIYIYIYIRYLMQRLSITCMYVCVYAAYVCAYVHIFMYAAHMRIPNYIQVRARVFKRMYVCIDG
jgi:hypothetical protein